MLIYVMLILFFTYFWTATQFKPEQIASDMKKNGAFIPGIRQGKPTQDFLESTMSRITLVRSRIFSDHRHPAYFGGTIDGGGCEYQPIFWRNLASDFGRSYFRYHKTN